MLFNETPKTMLEENISGFKNAFAVADDVECYQTQEGRGNKFHTDAIHNYKTWEELLETPNAKIGEWELMDEEEYNASVCANCGSRFSDMYEPGDKVLVIIYFIENN